MKLEYGVLIIQVSTAQQALPLSGALIRVYNDDQTVDLQFFSDENGKSPVIRIDAPDKDLSLDFDNSKLPYSTINVSVSCAGYAKRTFNNIQIFAEQESVLNVDLLVQNGNREPGMDEVIDLPQHSLVSGTVVKENNGSVRTDSAAPYVLDYPVIPKYVTVHLGKPSSSARNVTVNFKDYIKNVASSEIYPTWPKESLRANIYCQISLCLNRIYTEWYRSKGYDFDITNSTAYDQYFVYGRELFTSVSKIVDEIFNEYIRKQNTVNPYYAEYCDGRQVWCSGLKQWGTVDLANKGYNAFEILQYYYGTDIELIDTNRIEGVNGSFPGLNLRRGVRSDSVAVVQNQLNRIAVNYPNIPVTYPVDGIFGKGTEDSVKVFQRQFTLTPDGIVGKSTWYKLSYIYVAVKKLAELSSEGVEERLPGVYPGKALRPGARNVYVQEVQFYLQKISLFTSRVPPVKLDSSYGSSTRSAVVAFQRLTGLDPDGIVGRKTWDKLVEVYRQTQGVRPPASQKIPDYPGTALRVGSRSENVSIMQMALNSISQGLGNSNQIGVDGIFGRATEQAVMSFQRRAGLDDDGVIGIRTWNAISRQYSVATTNAIAYSEQNYSLARTLYENLTSLIYAMDNETSGT